MKIKQGVLSTHDEIMALAQHTKWEMIYNGQAYIYTKRDVYLEAELSRFPTYNDYVRSKRWDGKLPIYQGAATPFIQVN